MKVHVCRYCARVRVGKLDITVGGMARKVRGFWVWEGLHVWWGDRVARAFWGSSYGPRVQFRHEPLPVIPDPPAPASGDEDAPA